MKARLRASRPSGAPTCVATSRRLSTLPDIPTLAELGYPGLPGTFLALVAPAGTPGQIIAKVHADVTGIMNEPDFRKRHVIDRGLAPVVNTPAQFAEFLQRERTTTGALVKEAGIEPQ